MQKTLWMLWFGVLCMFVVPGAFAQSTVTTSGGTTNSVPVFTGSSTLGNSVITQSNGDVGIGTTAPAYALDIVGGNARVYGTSYGSNGNSASIALGDGHAGIAAVFGSGLRFDIYEPNSTGVVGPDAEDAMSIQQITGDVGIGTTSPSARLEVDGNLKLTSGSGASITFPDGTVQSTAYTGVACGGDYAEQVNVTGDRKHFHPGDVLVVDPDHAGQFLKSDTPYATAVAGVYSTRPGFVGHAVGMLKTATRFPWRCWGSCRRRSARSMDRFIRATCW